MKMSWQWQWHTFAGSCSVGTLCVRWLNEHGIDLARIGAHERRGEIGLVQRPRLRPKAFDGVSIGR